MPSPDSSSDEINSAVIMECVNQQLAQVQLLNDLLVSLDDQHKNSIQLQKTSQDLLSSLNSRLVTERPDTADAVRSLVDQIGLHLTTSDIEALLARPADGVDKSPQRPSPHLADADAAVAAIRSLASNAVSTPLASEVAPVAAAAAQSSGVYLSQLKEQFPSGAPAHPDAAPLCEIAALLSTYIADCMNSAVSPNATGGKDLTAAEEHYAAMRAQLTTATEEVSAALAARDPAAADAATRCALDLESDVLAAAEDVLRTVGSASGGSEGTGLPSVDTTATMSRKALDGVAALEARAEQLSDRITGDIHRVDEFLESSLNRQRQRSSNAAIAAADAQFREFLAADSAEEARLWGIVGQALAALKQLAKARCAKVKERITQSLTFVKDAASLTAMEEAASRHRTALVEINAMQARQLASLKIVRNMTAFAEDVSSAAINAVRSSREQLLAEARNSVLDAYLRWSNSRKEFLSRKRALSDRLSTTISQLQRDSQQGLERLDPEASSYAKEAAALQQRLSAVQSDIVHVERDVDAMSARMAPLLASSNGPRNRGGRVDDAGHFPRVSTPSAASRARSAPRTTGQTPYSGVVRQASQQPKGDGEAASLLSLRNMGRETPSHAAAHKRTPRVSVPGLEQPPSAENMPSIFNRLTDSTLYTGVHRFRFSDDGRGRGLAGRDSVMKGMGHEGRGHALGRGHRVKDLSEILRPNIF